MERHETSQEINNSQSAKELESDLLSGQLTPEKFLQMVLELDQSTPSREHSITNIEVLTSEPVKAYFADKEEYNFDYYNLISLTYFHIGQIEARDNPEKAKLHFISSLEASEYIQSDLGYEENWKNYIKGTLAYFDNDIKVLEAIFPQMEDSDNKNIVANMIKGLKTTNSVDYGKVYDNRI